MANCALNEFFFFKKKENYKTHCAFKHEYNKVTRKTETDLTAAH